MVTVNGDEHDDLVFWRRLTRGCLIQEGGRLLIFPPPCTLLRPPRLLILAKVSKAQFYFYA